MNFYFSKLIFVEEVGVLESVKVVSEVYSFILGVVIEVNIVLEDVFKFVNDFCYEKG